MTTLTDEQIDAERVKFEDVIGSSPFERNLERWPNDPERQAWPGSYVDINTDLAWHIWQAAIEDAVSAAPGKYRPTRDECQAAAQRLASITAPSPALREAAQVERIARDLGLWAEPHALVPSSRKHNRLLLEFAAKLR